MLDRWLKQIEYDTHSLTHLKRVRKTGDVTTLLLSTVAITPSTPQIPPEFGSAIPYVLQVPCSAALTQKALRHKASFWPTVYAPRKKHEPEPWSRAKVRWAQKAIRTVVQEANIAKAKREVLHCLIYSECD
jgi:tRNA-specific adenosine deaminase 3